MAIIRFDLCSIKCQPGCFCTCQRNIDVDTSFVGFNMLPIVSSKFQKDEGVGAKPHLAFVSEPQA